MRLAEKVALVTGAASGIGRAVAERFAQEGAQVTLFDLDEDMGERVMSSFHDNGADAFLSPGDVSRPADVKAAVTATVSAFGGLDILCNSAGILLIGHDLPVVELAEDVWERVIAVNLTGTFLMCKYGIPEMIKRGGGSIINMGSVAAFHGWDVAGAYGASKGGVVALTRDIAKAYAPHNIRANAICPGCIDTPMTLIPEHTENWQAAIELTPIKRAGTPDDVAGMATYLASDEASFVTGAALVVDGGLTA